jgi:hypothetical protein
LLILSTAESPLLDFTVDRAVTLDATPLEYRHVLAVRTDGIAIAILVESSAGAGTAVVVLLVVVVSRHRDP